MSVLEYTFPQDPKRLDVTSLSAAFERAVAGVKLKWERRPRGTPDWSAVTVTHPRLPRVQSVFVVAKNSAAEKRDLAARYTGDANLAVVLDTSILIWSQLKGLLSSPAAAILTATDTHNALIAAVSRLGKGVVDLPENERLYSVVAFGRYAKRRLTARCSGRAGRVHCDPKAGRVARH